MLFFEEVGSKDLSQVAQLYNKLAFEVKATSKDDYFDFDTLSDEIMLNNLSDAVKEHSIKIYVAKEGTEVVGFISGTTINCFLSTPVWRSHDSGGW